jgi:hypothetical protein
VSFPPDQRRCLYCGAGLSGLGASARAPGRSKRIGRLERRFPDESTTSEARLPTPEQLDPRSEALDVEEEQEFSPMRALGRGGMTGIWILLGLTATCNQLCR